MAEHTPPPLDPEAIIETLSRHQVRYVLIGGLAAVAHGWPEVTLDADITPARDRANLGRLAAALRELGAKLRVPGLAEGVEVKLDAKTFDLGNTWTFTTSCGALDVCLFPTGTQGYPELERAAVDREAFGITIAVASLDDIIRTKQAAGRDKDLTALPGLRRLRDRLSKPPP